MVLGHARLDAAEAAKAARGGGGPTASLLAALRGMSLEDILSLHAASEVQR